jgi:hypothetical protein
LQLVAAVHPTGGLQLRGKHTADGLPRRVRRHGIGQRKLRIVRRCMPQRGDLLQWQLLHQRAELLLR